MQVQDFVKSVTSGVESVRSAVKGALRRKTPLPAGLRRPPQLSGGLPLVGHSMEFISGTVELLTRAHKELGEVASFQVFNRRMVAVYGPEAHEAVFRAPDAQLSPSEAYKIMTPVFGKDIVYDASPEKMTEQLKMLLPALKDRRMRTYGEAVVKEVEDTLSAWGDSGTIDFVDFCRVLTNFTSSRCLLGNEFREGMTAEFASVYHDLERGVTPLAYINAHLPIPSFIKRDRARVRMVEMIGAVIGERKRDKRQGEDFLQTLMDARYADGKALSDSEITGMLLAGMFAGHHTSSVTTAWTLFDLLANKEYLARSVTEIDRVFGGGEPVSHDLLRKLTLVENAVKESLRLHPPLFMLVRVAKQDFVYKDYFIPAGTWILVSPTVSHRMPEVFKNPDAFEPDRYMPPREEDKRDFAYIAFGGGRHKCMGNAFAILQIKAILAILLGQYEFELVGPKVEADFHGLVIGPKDGSRVRYRKRAQPSVTSARAAELARIAQTTAEEAAAAAAAAGCPAHAPGATAAAPNASVPVAAAPPPGCPAHVHAAAAEVAPAKAVKLSIKLDHDLCQGHAACVGDAPEVFYIGKNGKVAAKTFSPSPEQHEAVRRAAQYCPSKAIKLREV